MNKQDAIKIVKTFQKWRRAQKPYDKQGTRLPYTPTEIGEAIDYILKILKEDEQRL